MNNKDAQNGFKCISSSLNRNKKGVIAGKRTEELKAECSFHHFHELQESLFYGKVLYDYINCLIILNLYTTTARKGSYKEFFYVQPSYTSRALKSNRQQSMDHLSKATYSFMSTRQWTCKPVVCNTWSLQYIVAELDIISWAGEYCIGQTVLLEAPSELTKFLL